MFQLIWSVQAPLQLKRPRSSPAVDYDDLARFVGFCDRLLTYLRLSVGKGQLVGGVAGDETAWELSWWMKSMMVWWWEVGRRREDEACWSA